MGDNGEGIQSLIIPPVDFCTKPRLSSALDFSGGEKTQSTHEILNSADQGLRTPGEGINQRNLKIWADVADKICFGRT